MDMVLPAAIARPAPVRRNMVVLQIDELRLMLAQGDIRSVESAVDLDRCEAPENGAGWISYAGRVWPAYCVSGQLMLQREVPVSRSACAVLAYAGGFIGLLCDDVRVLGDFADPGCEVPAAMRSPHSPVDRLVQYESALACISSAARLAVCLQRPSTH